MLCVGFLFFCLYRWVFTELSVGLAILYGISKALIGLNVQHDANHGALSKKRPWINHLLGLGCDFMGGDKWLWLQQHWTHHAFTNDEHKDPDGKSAEPLIILNNYPPGHAKRRWFHRFQAFFVSVVLAGYWVTTAFSTEIVDLKHRGSLASGMKMESRYISERRKYAMGFRLLYFLCNFVAPVYRGESWLKVILLLHLAGAAGSLPLATLFTLSHNFEGADRSPLKSGEAVCWSKSQVETSCTYGGCLSGALTGGLNFQIEHHLFPRMCSAWYPFIAPTVRKVCEKHGVRYRYFPWIWQNWLSTIRYMHAAGTDVAQPAKRE